MKKNPTTPLERLRTGALYRLAQQGLQIDPISQERVGDELGLSKVQVGRFERGANELKLSYVAKLARLYGVDEAAVYEAARDTRAQYLRHQAPEAA